MAGAILYVATAAALVWTWNRFVQPAGRAAAIVLILLPLLFTGRALLTGRAYSPADLLFLDPPFSDYAHDYGMENPRNGMLSDLARQIVPWQQAVRAAWRAGEWPLWNGSILSGDVLAAAMQPGVFDPFNLLALALPLYLATTYGAAVTLFLAALSAFALAREIGTSEGAALVAAAGYALSSGIAFNAGWPLGRAWALVPLVLFAVSRVVRDRDLRAGVVLAVALALMIVAGHPETLLHAAGAGGLWGLFELMRTRKAPLRAIGIVCAAGVAALLVTALALLPFLAVLRHSSEYQERAAAGAIPPQPSDREQRNELLATFLPFHGGASWHSLTSEWEFGWGRAGSVVLALACVAAVTTRRNPITIFLAVMAVAAFLVARHLPPLSRLVDLLPLFKIAVNSRYTIFFALCVSLLAAIGVGAGSQPARPREHGPAKSRPLHVILAAGIALALPTAFIYPWEVRHGVDPKWIAACAFAELGGVALAFVAMRRGGAAAITIILAAICMQRAVEDGSIYPAIEPRAFFPPVPLVSAIPRNPLYRVVGTGPYLRPNVATMYGLDDVRGYEAMTFAPLVVTYSLWSRAEIGGNRVGDLSRPFLSFLGVRYALAPVTTAPPDGWRVVRDDRGSRLLENTRALPRLFVPRNVEIVANVGEAMAAMQRAADFSETAWLFTRDVPPRAQANAAAKLDAHRVGSRYEVDAAMPADGWLVVTESAWPGWRAYVDGRRVKTIPANVAFFAVFVPAGRHHVRVVYLPEAFVQGRAISFATLALIAIGFGWRRWRR